MRGGGASVERARPEKCPGEICQTWGSPTLMPPSRLVLLTQYFPPEVYPQTLWLAQAVRGHGFDTHILTAAPNYPSGTVLPGYSARRSKREIVDGFRVTRGPVFPSHDENALGRVANYVSFGAGAGWAGRRVLRSADAVLVWATPATVGVPALWARLTSGTPYVLFVQDLWPDSVFATGFLRDPRLERVARLGLTPYLSALYRNSAHVIAITPGMRQALIDRGVPEEKTSVVFNWVDEDAMRPVAPNGRLRAILGVGERDVIIVFAGNLGSAQGLETWIRAMHTLKDHDHVHLVLIGRGSERDGLRELSTQLGLDSVHFLDQVPVDELSDLIADAELAALSLTDQPLFHITVPSKTQAILAQGKGVLSSAPGEASEIVRRADAGWIATPDSVDDIAQMILQARAAGVDEIRRRGLNGRQFYLDNMGKSVGSARIAAILNEAVDRRGAQR